jgi:hypothetical protein
MNYGRISRVQDLAQDRVQRRALVNSGMILRVP